MKYETNKTSSERKSQYVWNFEGECNGTESHNAKISIIFFRFRENSSTFLYLYGTSSMSFQMLKKLGISGIHIFGSRERIMERRKSVVIAQGEEVFVKLNLHLMMCNCICNKESLTASRRIEIWIIILFFDSAYLTFWG